MTCGVDATINCTNSNGVNPPKLIVISSPVEIVASATMGVGATGSAWTVARAGGGTVVVDELGAAVVGAAVVAGAVVAGAVVAGDVVSGVEGVVGEVPDNPILKMLRTCTLSEPIPLFELPASR